MLEYLLSPPPGLYCIELIADGCVTSHHYPIKKLVGRLMVGRYQNPESTEVAIVHAARREVFDGMTFEKAKLLASGNLSTFLSREGYITDADESSML